MIQVSWSGRPPETRCYPALYKIAKIGGKSRRPSLAKSANFHAV